MKTYRWTGDVVDVLVDAYRLGGHAAVYAAFPERDRKSVDAAIRRFILRAVDPRSCKRKPQRSAAQARAILRAMSAAQLLEELALFMPRNTNARDSSR